MTQHTFQNAACMMISVDVCCKEQFMSTFLQALPMVAYHYYSCVLYKGSQLRFHSTTSLLEGTVLLIHQVANFC